MESFTSRDGAVISYDRSGVGPPLVLVHGSFSDHATNWMYVAAELRERFTLYAIARRGRGETTATEGHSLADEAADVAALVSAIGEPVFLLGHSYGALCALEAAAMVPHCVARLVLYEPARPDLMSAEVRARVEELGARGAWDEMAEAFLIGALRVLPSDVAALRATPDWATWTSDAKATLGDLRALARHRIDVARFGALSMPVLMLIGSESPRDLYLTDVLAKALPDVKIVSLKGQAHEGMTTAPALFADVVSRFLSA